MVAFLYFISCTEAFLLYKNSFNFSSFRGEGNLDKNVLDQYDDRKCNIAVTYADGM